MCCKLIVVAVCMVMGFSVMPGRAFAAEGAPVIKKLGTIDCDMVETTPVVFKSRLYRFEYVRDNYKPNTTGKSYFRFIDVASGDATPSFAAGYHLGSAYVEGETMYVFGVNMWGKERIQVFWSKDLKQWEDKPALVLPGWEIFNNSVCKGKDGRYVMAFEIGAPPEETGVAFTTRFATSVDLLAWALTPSACVYTKERYSACPALRYLDGDYYMIYLESYPGYWAPHIVRSKDLVVWEESPFKPIMKHSGEDKRIANPKLTEAERKRIADAVDVNNSDVDFCEFEGKTIIYYSWGNQQGIEHLAEAVYEGPEAAFLKGFFPSGR